MAQGMQSSAPVPVVRVSNDEFVARPIAFYAKLQSLEAAELQHYADVLEEMLGAAVVEDLLEMEPEDMELLGLKKLERKRLARAVLRLRAEVEAQADE